jgi:hypothetical protein
MSLINETLISAISIVTEWDVDYGT